MTDPLHRLSRALVPVAIGALVLAACSSPDGTVESEAPPSTDATEGTDSSTTTEVHHDHAGMADEEMTDDKGFALLANGHQHESEEVELDAATQAQLDEQLASTQDLVERFPTVADATAAGYTRAGPFSPGLGTHYSPPEYHLNADGVIDAEDIPWPMLIFDGVEPESKLAGFMYLAYGATEPEGFAGPNERWHYHEKVCIVPREGGGIDTPFGADLEGVTEQMCTDVGGTFIAFTGYMVHVWTVPGYESELGVFSELNPAITCPDGTYYTIPIEELGVKDSTCVTAS